MDMDIAIVGGGIGGLTLALALDQRSIPARVYEGVAEVKELGVGITLLPHAMREYRALGLDAALLAQGVETREACHYNRFGQLIHGEKRGRFAGYPVPELMIHRARLHLTLWNAAIERLGRDRILADHECVGLDQDEDRATLHFRDRPDVVADVVVGCDGVNSTIRRKFYPDERLAFGGINTWRGVTRMKPFLGGQTYVRAGAMGTGNLVVYPIENDIDGNGTQLINWTTQVYQPGFEANDWNRRGKLEDFVHIYESWKFDWLDVPDMIRRAHVLLEYPMIDKDPVARWTFGRVTLLGDAAHPMYQRGSNGSAQAVIDSRVLADELAKGGDARDAFAAYEAARRETTARIVETNRAHPPDYMIIKVEELVGDKPFDDLDKYITRAELDRMMEDYKRVTGYALAELA
jgi:5-methylphenazine-1-carboxylate 1-monooxygenase